MKSRKRWDGRCGAVIGEESSDTVRCTAEVQQAHGGRLFSDCAFGFFDRKEGAIPAAKRAAKVTRLTKRPLGHRAGLYRAAQLPEGVL